jgi:4-amino-4-deoxy-L-arabinose transferase-like glycosyltransferase
MHKNLIVRPLRIGCVAAAVLFLTYSCVLATQSVRGLTPVMHRHAFWPLLCDKPVGEDGFYMLTVADNLATTQHLVYNYNLPATGIQPLATFIYAAIAAVVHLDGGDRWTLVRVVIIFGAVLCVLFAWQIARFAQRFAPPNHRQLVFTLAFFLILFDFSVFRTLIFGLETGVYLCCLAVCMALWHRIVAGSPPRWRDILLLGVAAGFAGLARIDFGLLFAFLLLYLLLRRRASIPQVLVCGVLALAIVSPWFLFVHRVTGGWMPTSGSAESELAWHGANRFEPWSRAILAHIVPWSFAGSVDWFSLTLGVTGLLLIAILIVRSRWLHPKLAAPVLRDTFFSWFIAIFALTLVYAGFFQSTFFYVRYFSPLLIVSVPLLALLLAEQPLLQKRPEVFLAALVLLFTALDYVALHRGRISNPHYPAAAYVSETFPAVHVGAFQSGVIGYFNADVENLDGKLNVGALRAAMNGSLDRFIDHEGINVLIDWPSYFNQLPQQYLAIEWQACPKTPPNPQDVCYIRRSFLLTHPAYR